MAMERDSIRSSLNDLIQVCRDSEQGYRTAAEKVKSSQTLALFLNCARQRAEFALELQGQLGRDRAQSAGTAYDVWGDLKSALIGNHDHALLEEAERGEDTISKAYREVLGKDLPEDLWKIVEKQYREIERTHQMVRDLRDKSRTAEIPMAGLM